MNIEKIVSRHGFVSISVLVSCLIFLSALCGQTQAQEWNNVADGVEYTQVRREFGGKLVDINLLRLDLKKVRLDVRHAMDMAIGTETTSSIATRHRAFAAINAGFFRLDKSEFAGDNVGLLMIDDYLWSEPTLERVAIGIINHRKKTEVFFDRWDFAGYLRLKSADRPDVLKGLNRERKDNEVIAYTPSFGKVVTRTGEETGIVVQRNRVAGRCSGECEIPRDGFVLIGNGPRSSVLQQLNIGDRVQLVWDIRGKNNTQRAYKLEDAVAGVPQLIRNGKIDITWVEEKATKSFVETRHPRTAVAKLKDGKFLMITVDGRTESSGGISLYDLADYLLSLGAVEAMNLDGGGSSTMFLDGKVVNHPSDKDGERKVSDAILITLRSKK